MRRQYRHGIESRLLKCYKTRAFVLFYIVAKVSLATKKEIMVISTIIRTFLIEANKTPHVQLTTKGVEITVFEKYWKNELLHLCYIAAQEGPTMGLPGDDAG